MFWFRPGGRFHRIFAKIRRVTVFLTMITQITVKNDPVGVDALIDPFPKLEMIIL